MRRIITITVAMASLNVLAFEPKSIDLSYEQVLDETAYAIQIPRCPKKPSSNFNEKGTF